MHKCEDVTHGNRIMSFHRHGGDQSIDKTCKVTLNWGFTLFWVVNVSFKHLSLSCETCNELGKILSCVWITISSEKYKTEHVPIHPTWRSWPGLLGAPKSPSQKDNNVQQRDGSGWSCRILGPILFPHQPQTLWIKTAKPPGFPGGRELWCCGFFCCSIFSQSKTSLPLYFMWTRKPKKVCFRHINTQCFQNEICSPDAPASQRNWWSCQFCCW